MTGFPGFLTGPTTGVDGNRGWWVQDDDLQRRGWKVFWESKAASGQENPHLQESPHVHSWLWACFFWAYEMNPDLSSVSPSQLARLREHYRAALFDDIVPWWEKHSLDRECGGYYSLLERDGRPWATDKYMWPTGREVWMFSHLYNSHERNPAWLNAAQLGADFVLQHAFLPDGGGKMYFRLTRDGRPMSKALSLYTEMFGAIALAELSRAAGSTPVKCPDFTSGKWGTTKPKSALEG
jgi:hypothetical protein